MAKLSRYHAHGDAGHGEIGSVSVPQDVKIHSGNYPSQVTRLIKRSGGAR
jgi:hypothetical protein